MVPESNRLGRLKVSEARHNGLCFAFGQVQQTGPQAPEFLGNHINFITQVQADIRGHLIIAAATSVQFLTRDANAIR